MMQPFDFGFVDQSCDIKQRALATLAREEQAQCRPTNIYMIRPDAPSVWPIFKTTEEQYHWMRNQEKKNSDYSDEVFDRRMLEWRTKNNWLLPPMKTAVTQEEQRHGFYVSFELDKPGNPMVKYATPYSTAHDLQNAELVNMMWCLIHSRADNLVACKTVGEFNALFDQTVRLEYPAYERRMNRIVNPRKLLWLFSQKANVFPGKARFGTARWTVDPNYQYPAPVFDPKVYTKSMVFFNPSDDYRCCANAAKPVYLVGAAGGRDETGICVVERLTQFGDEAKIRWLLSAAQLRKMERVVFSPDCCPFRTSQAYDSDDYYTDDWL